MTTRNRPDLSERSILLLDICVIAFAVLVLALPELPAPGSVPGQLSAALGAVLLLAPFVFVVMKRSGRAESPPAWFIAHVVATALGSLLIFVHVKSGDWLTPPGIVLALLLFLLLQGSLMRVVLARGFSLLFARSSAAQGFSAPADLDKQALQQVIDDKVSLLAHLDAQADESRFSPALKHWLQHPWLSLQYQRLADREAAIVGARSGAGAVLAWSRRLHMFAALAFYLGLVAHIVIVLFFAGYAAGGGEIGWWHITAWGG